MKNDKRTKATTDRREYKRLTTIDQDPYRDECWSRHGRWSTKSVIGSKNSFAWKRKVIYRFQYRAYRTWKHNRKTKWK